jgi:DNA-binding response OmpR family regulator
MAAIAQQYDELALTLAVFDPHLVVANVGEDVTEAIERIRGTSDVPILALVARRGDAVAAFNGGADDVLELPPDMEELSLRVASILRRRHVDELTHVGDLVVDRSAFMAWRGDKLLELTVTEFNLLDLLVRNADVVITKRQMLSEVWGFDHFDVNVVEVHISALRRKLEQFGPRVIHTVRSIGYVVRTGAAVRASGASGSTSAVITRQLRGL